MYYGFFVTTSVNLLVIYLSHPCSYLQDKWRNLSVSNAQQGSKDKIRGPKLKTTVVAPLSNTPNSAPAASLTRNVSSGAVMNDTSTSALDGKNGPKCVFLFLLLNIYINNIYGIKCLWQKSFHLYALIVQWEEKELGWNNLFQYIVYLCDWFAVVIF